MITKDMHLALDLIAARANKQSYDRHQAWCHWLEGDNPLNKIKCIICDLEFIYEYTKYKDHAIEHLKHLKAFI